MPEKGAVIDTVRGAFGFIAGSGIGVDEAGSAVQAAVQSIFAGAGASSPPCSSPQWPAGMSWSAAIA